MFYFNVSGTTINETDLRLTITAGVTISLQCGIATSNGTHILGLIRRI